jgi:hypothetical protein
MCTSLLTICAKCHSHLTPIDFIILFIFGEEYKL